MPKRISDVVPPNKRSIRHIPLPSSRKRRVREQKAEEIPEEEVLEGEEENDPVQEYFEERPRKSHRLFIIGTIGAVIALFFIISWFIAGATVTITPRTETRSINAIISAAALKSASKDLAFEKISLDKSLSSELSPDGERQVERRASGKIVVYNNFSREPQRLIKNTRFETPQGLIYRIDESITIPGKSVEDGKAVPGSIEVTVYADSPGPSYNIGLTDFTIPGFKSDTERFKNFYARSKTPMEGGFVGTEKFVTKEKVEATAETLRAQLKSDLAKEARVATPNSFILYDNAFLVAFDPIKEEASERSVKVSVTAHLTGFLLKREELDKVIAKKSGIDATDAEHRITVANAQELTFAFQGIPESTTDIISFKLEGAPVIIWKFDEQSIKQALAGKAEREAETILKGFVGIERAEIVTRPFWKSTFPEDGADIKVVSSLKETRF